MLECRGLGKVAFERLADGVKPAGLGEGACWWGVF